MIIKNCIMSYEPHDGNAWIIYIALLYILALVGRYLWSVVKYNDTKDYPTMEPFVRKKRKKKKEKFRRPIIRQIKK